jgi:hypothetical protein
VFAVHQEAEIGEEVDADEGTLITRNHHVKSRRSHRLRLRYSHPEVGMFVSLAAQLTRSLRRGMSLRAYTRRSEPVSTRNCRLLSLSVMNKWSVIVEQTCAAVDVRYISFPASDRRRAEYMFEPWLRSGDGTSKGWICCTGGGS